MLQQMEFKKAVNATFFIIMVAILFLDAMVISKYEHHLKEQFKIKDRERNSGEIKEMFEAHVEEQNWKINTTSAAVNWEKGAWQHATEEYLRIKENCVCMSLQLGICYTLFLVHLGIMGLGIIVYVVICGLQFHKSMYIINIVSFLCLTVGVSVETHFILEQNNDKGDGEATWGKDVWPNLLKYIIFKWTLFVLNLITICIQSVQCICGYSVDQDDYAHAPEMIRTFSRRFRNSVRGFQDPNTTTETHELRNRSNGPRRSGATSTAGSIVKSTQRVPNFV